ncbi:hypothetical protein EVAR_97542_1 [Eumeta japonica]|uniref:Uncharacterized protein n=1 Tax=Eumeta variegata TaxID=151549 RepID=A0A4C1WLC7_EUMVA|nr:hypothetical protein EVAR_97542_1 [Eumeta japonica]
MENTSGAANKARGRNNKTNVSHNYYGKRSDRRVQALVLIQRFIVGKSGKCERRSTKWGAWRRRPPLGPRRPPRPAHAWRFGKHLTLYTCRLRGETFKKQPKASYFSPLCSPLVISFDGPLDALQRNEVFYHCFGLLLRFGFVLNAKFQFTKCLQRS